MSEGRPSPDEGGDLSPAPHGGSPRLSMTVLELAYTPRAPLFLPEYPGSTIRGVFGSALRAIACATGASECSGCPIASRCVYGNLWEALADDGPKRYASPPRAYAIELLASPSRADSPIEPGQPIGFRLKLFGAARGWQPQLIAAAAGAAELGWSGERVPMLLQAVDRVEPDGSSTSLWSPLRGARPLPIGPAHRVDPVARSVRGGELRLRLHTPTALKSEGKMLRRFDPVVFTQRLCQRLEMMARAHEGLVAHWDFRAFWDLAEQVRIVRDDTRRVEFGRVSRRQQGRSISVEGLVGAVHVTDVDDRLAALWACAAAIHVGKGSVFGLGHITID